MYRNAFAMWCQPNYPQNPSRKETFSHSPAVLMTLQSCIPASRAVLRTPEAWGGNKWDSLHRFLGSRSISETFPRLGSVTPSPHWVRISGRSSCVHHVELQRVFHRENPGETQLCCREEGKKQTQKRADNDNSKFIIS